MALGTNTYMFMWKGHLCTLSYFSRKSSGIHNIHSVCWGCLAHHWHHQFLVPTTKALPFHVPFTFTLVGDFVWTYIVWLPLQKPNPLLPLAGHVDLSFGWRPVGVPRAGLGSKKAGCRAIRSRKHLDEASWGGQHAGDFCWVNISSFPWKFNGGTCLIWSMSIAYMRKVVSPCCNWPAKNLRQTKKIASFRSHDKTTYTQISDLRSVLTKLSDFLRICGTRWN